MTVELRPVKGNKPHKGKYTTIVNNDPYEISYERFANKIRWSIRKRGIPITEVDSKQAVIEFLNQVAQDNGNLTEVKAMWDSITPNGFRARISVTLESADNKIKANIQTSAINPDNNMLAINWLTREVSEYWRNNFGYTPNLYNIQWGVK